MNTRPTLPSIHSLNLPLLARPSNSNLKNGHHDNVRRSHNHAARHEREFSSSSLTTVSSTTLISPGDNAHQDSGFPSPMTPIPNIAPGSKFRLRPCSLEDAEAIIAVTLPDRATFHPSNHWPQQNEERGILVFGPAVEKFRNPQRPLAKNARVQPYRFVRNPPSSGSRGSSVISITAHPFSNVQAR